MVHDGGVTVRRIWLVVTVGAVAILGVVLTVLSWDRASRMATVVSALAAVAAVGIAVWAALRGSEGSGRAVRVSNTGSAVAGRGGVAVSGVAGQLAESPTAIHVEVTGVADASGGGEAVSGVRLT